MRSFFEAGAWVKWNKSTISAVKQLDRRGVGTAQADIAAAEAATGQ